jgi:undecaprenyl-diphosphatase
VTPGGLGLEFTTLLAVLAVSLYVLIAYTAVVSGNPDPTTGDQTAMDIARHAEAPWLTHVAKVVTEFGSALVTLPLTVVVAVLLALRRRWIEVAVLLASTAIIYLGVAELKQAISRPRPAAPLTDSSGSAFPSGHAAHSILYPWLALVLTVRLRPGMAGSSALLVAGIAIAALVGLSRVYLRVHYFSDVAGGWALGVAAFAACAAVAMVVIYFRQNEPSAIGDRD